MKRHRQSHRDKRLDRPSHIPERTCVACRAKRPSGELLRLAATAAGEIILDRSGRLPGRGVYVCFDTGCLRHALKPAKLAFAFRRPVNVPTIEAVYPEVIKLLHTRLGMTLSLAQKAGAVVSGYTPLRKALAQQHIVCMVLAKDIADSRAEEYRAWCDKLNIPCWTRFTKESLGNFIGRTNRSAIGITGYRFREMLCATMTSLEKLCSNAISTEGKSELS